jgi:hypothetical protein
MTLDIATVMPSILIWVFFRGRKKFKAKNSHKQAEIFIYSIIKYNYR